MDEQSREEIFSQDSTAGEIVEKLLAEAAETGKMKPIGQSIDFMQQQVSGLYTQIQYAVENMGKMIGQLQIGQDTARLTMSLIIKTMISKGIVTREEFDTSYQTEVVDVMRKIMDDFRAKYEETQREKEEKVDQAETEEKEEGEVKTPAKISLVPEAIEEESGEESGEDYSDIVLASEAAKMDKENE
jgi:hypothetical protein